MQQQEIETSARKIITEHLNVSGNRVHDEANFIQDLGADSLDTVELLMAIEEEFDIPINEDQAESMKTFADAVNIIYEMVNGVQLDRAKAGA